MFQIPSKGSAFVRRETYIARTATTRFSLDLQRRFHIDFEFRSVW